MHFKKNKVVRKNDDGKFKSVHTSKLKAGKRRTYFFDVKRTKSNDYYIILTESIKKMDTDDYERHKLYLYKEDFNRFLAQLQATIDHVKTTLMPDFDYEEQERRQAEWEASRALRDDEEKNEVDLDW